MKLYRLTILLLSVYSVSSFKRVCYYTNWSQSRPAGGRFTPEDIDPYLCTHIIFAYARIVGDQILPTEWNDENRPYATGQYERVTSLKHINPDLKVLLGVNGWNTVNLLTDWPNAEHFRSKFIESAIEFLRRRNFDGVELNWSLPTARRVRPVKREIFTKLLEELRHGFDKEANATGNEPLLLTAAVSPDRAEEDTRYDVPKLSGLLDFINVMAFDLHGPWQSTLEHHSALFPRSYQIGDERYKNVAEIMIHWLDLGAPKQKLLVGIPFYGRSFTTLTPGQTDMGDPDRGVGPAGLYTLERGFMSYYEICELLSNGADRRWHSEHQAPYLVNDTTWVAYDDTESIEEKIKWLMAEQLGGVAIWALDHDDFWGDFCNKGPYPLLQTVYDQLTAPDIGTPLLKDNVENKFLTREHMSETIQLSVKQSKIEQASSSVQVNTTTDIYNRPEPNAMQDLLPTKDQLAIVNGDLVDNMSTDKHTIDSNINAQESSFITTNDQNSQNDNKGSDSGLLHSQEIKDASATIPVSYNAINDAEIRNSANNLPEVLFTETLPKLNPTERNTGNSETENPNIGMNTNKDVFLGNPDKKPLTNTIEHNIQSLSVPIGKIVTDGNSFKQVNAPASNFNRDSPKELITKGSTMVYGRETFIPFVPFGEFSTERVKQNKQNKNRDLKKIGRTGDIPMQSNIGRPAMTGLGTETNNILGLQKTSQYSHQATLNNRDLSNFQGPDSTSSSVGGIKIPSEQASVKDLSLAERRVYDISPSIKNAVPKTMTSRERKSYTDKVKKQRIKTVDIVMKNTPDSLTFNKGGSNSGTADKRARANSLFLWRGTSGQHIKTKSRPNQESRPVEPSFNFGKNNNNFINNSVRQKHVSSAPKRTSIMSRPTPTRTRKAFSLDKTFFKKQSGNNSGKRKGFSLDNTFFNKPSSLNSAGRSELYMTNGIDVPLSVICSDKSSVLCFDHINKVYIHGKDWETLQGVYEKPENYTTTPDPTEIVVHHPNEI